jgi:hypothetical protein
VAESRQIRPACEALLTTVVCCGSDLADLVTDAERGYVRARFGTTDVLITPELAAEIRASREKKGEQE